MVTNITVIYEQIIHRICQGNFGQNLQPSEKPHEISITWPPKDDFQQGHLVLQETRAVYKDKELSWGGKTNSMSEKKQAEMDICDKCNTADILIASCSFHYAWEETDVLFSHKKIKRKQHEQQRKTRIKKLFRQEQLILK